MEIREYGDEDWDSIAAIHDTARLEELRLTVGEDAFLTLEETADSEGLFDDELWIAVEEDRPIGFVAFDPDEITWLYVDPTRSRTGIGRALLRHALSRCSRPVEVSVLEGNDPAIALYESEGFEITDTKTGALTGNESFKATGHTMVLSDR